MQKMILDENTDEYEVWYHKQLSEILLHLHLSKVVIFGEDTSLQERKCSWKASI